jgi:hypothetical protein
VRTDPFERARRVADAVLWEGYVLYPYRASAAKNQLRWQYGVLTPRPYAEADGHERWSIQTECVLEGRGPGRVDVRLRYLQVQTRTVEQAADGGFVPVAELEADGQLWASWDEAVEHDLDIVGFEVVDGASLRVPVSLDGARAVEMIGGAGRVVRERWPLEAVVGLDCARSPGPDALSTLRVTVANTTDWNVTGGPRDIAMRHSLVGVHTLLHAVGRRFLSLLEPPERARTAVDACTNLGTFPVLVGDPDDPTVMLSSPIILYDHPAVAAESPLELCDATEIDEILALRVLTLTDDEKRLARSTDPRAAAIVDGIEAFSPDVFASLHGEMRPVDRLPAADRPPWWEPAAEAAVDPWSDSLDIGGSSVAKGSRVRLRPGRAANRRTDAQDLFLVGLEATVAGVFLDVDGEHHVAVTLDDDPLGDVRSSTGRFLYFHPDELEALA